jgi:hypothetical protein
MQKRAASLTRSPAVLSPGPYPHHGNGRAQQDVTLAEASEEGRGWLLVGRIGVTSPQQPRSQMLVDAVCCVYFCAAGKYALLVSILTELEMEILIPAEVGREVLRKRLGQVQAQWPRLWASSRVRILDALTVMDGCAIASGVDGARHSPMATPTLVRSQRHWSAVAARTLDGQGPRHTSGQRSCSKAPQHHRDPSDRRS